MNYLTRDLTLSLDVNRCIGCGLCAIVCPHGVFAIENKKARLLDRDACMECGACAMNCPVEAIEVDSGVGCAEAIINGLLTGKETCCGGDCCCSTTDKKDETDRK
jgi:NAD-dependent dihydropyrimidine dehydrogenase PreA subunit